MPGLPSPQIFFKKGENHTLVDKKKMGKNPKKWESRTLGSEDLHDELSGTMDR